MNDEEKDYSLSMSLLEPHIKVIKSSIGKLAFDDAKGIYAIINRTDPVVDEDENLIYNMTMKVSDINKVLIAVAERPLKESIDVFCQIKRQCEIQLNELNGHTTTDVVV